MTSRTVIPYLALAVSLLLMQTAVGETHNWSSSSGDYAVTAEFVKLEDGAVTLRKPDKTEVTVPLEKLDKKSQQLADGLSKRKSGDKSANQGKYVNNITRVRNVFTDGDHGPNGHVFSASGSNFVRLSDDHAFCFESQGVFYRFRDGKFAAVFSNESKLVGMKAGEYLKSVDYQTVSADGQVSLIGLIYGDSNQYVGRGVWTEQDGKLAMIARSNSHVSADKDSPIFEHFYRVERDRFGNIIFTALLLKNIGGVVESENDRGVWLCSHNNLQRLEPQGGDAAPEQSESMRKRGIKSRPKIFTIGLSENDECEIFQDPNSTQEPDRHRWLVTKDGTLSLVEPPSNMKPTGDSDGQSSSDKKRGRLANATASPPNLPKPGSEVPGMPADVRFEKFDRIFKTPSGQLAVQAQLVTGPGGVTKENNEGIWAVDASGAVQLICQKGSRIGKHMINSVELLGMNRLGEIGFKTGMAKGIPADPDVRYSYWISDYFSEKSNSP